MSLRALAAAGCLVLSAGCSAQEADTATPASPATSSAGLSATAVPPSSPGPSPASAGPSVSATSPAESVDARTVSLGVRLDRLETTGDRTSAEVTNLNDVAVDVAVRVYIQNTGAAAQADLSGRSRLSGRSSATVELLPTEPGASVDATCSDDCSYIFKAEVVEVADEEPNERACTPDVCRLQG